LKPTLKKPKKILVQAKLPEDLVDAIDELCEAEGISRARFVEVAVRELSQKIMSGGASPRPDGE
jgi:metal-responsive CopG/Arc/MetJ family transcriptional regulator